MKFRKCFLIVGLCALILQFGVISCQDEAEGNETDVAQETTNSEAVDETVNSDADNAEENSNNAEENATDDNEEEGEQANEPEQTDEDSPEESGDAQDDSGDENGESTEEEEDEEEVYEPPPVGTELDFDLDTSVAGFSVNIYFTQAAEGLSMHCDVSAQSGTDAAAFFPNEFEDEEENDSQDEGDNENSPSDNSNEGDSDANGEDANVVENGDLDAENTDPNAQDDTDDENNVVDDSDDTQSPSDENASNDDEDAETNDVVNEDGTDESNGDGEANDEDGNTGRRRQTRGSCTGDMPHLYLLKDTGCCSNPNAAGCASTEAYKLGCLDKTGSSDHGYTDLKYEDVEAMCLAITPSEVATGFRRAPKFIASGPSFFRTFSLLNFNNINFLSSGTKTITSNPSTGAVSVNFPSYIPQSSGGSYTPGFFDTLPYIRLEGLTADYINVITILLILTYVASIFLPLLNLGPLVSQLTAPFERMGDFASERMDILADKVRASIRKYNRRRYYNDVRRVDYDLNYEYIDDDYYYYDK